MSRFVQNMYSQLLHRMLRHATVSKWAGIQGSPPTWQEQFHQASRISRLNLSTTTSPENSAQKLEKKIDSPQNTKEMPQAPPTISLTVTLPTPSNIPTAKQNAPTHATKNTIVENSNTKPPLPPTISQQTINQQSETPSPPSNMLTSKQNAQTDASKNTSFENSSTNSPLAPPISKQTITQKSETPPTPISIKAVPDKLVQAVNEMSTTLSTTSILTNKKISSPNKADVPVSSKTTTSENIKTTSTNPPSVPLLSPNSIHPTRNPKNNIPSSSEMATPNPLPIKNSYPPDPKQTTPLPPPVTSPLIKSTPSVDGNLKSTTVNIVEPSLKPSKNDLYRSDNNITRTTSLPPPVTSTPSMTPSFDVNLKLKTDSKPKTDTNVEPSMSFKNDLNSNGAANENNNTRRPQNPKLMTPESAPNIPYINPVQNSKYTSSHGYESTINMEMIKNKSDCLSQITLIGYVGQDPTFYPLRVASTSNNNQLSTPLGVTRLVIATNEAFTNAQGDIVKKTTWHVTKCYNPTTSNIILNLVRKGSKVFVTGKLSYECYKTKRNVEKVEAVIKLGILSLPPTKKETQ